MVLIAISIVFGLLHVWVEYSWIFLVALLVVAANVVLVLKYPIWGLLLYTIVYLFRPGEVYPAIAAIRPGLMVGGLAVLSLMVNQLALCGRIALPKDRTTLTLTAFLVAMSLSVFTSYEATETVNSCVSFLKIMIFYYLIVSLIDTRKRLIQFLVVFAIMIAYIGADAFQGYLTGDYIHRMNMDRLTGSTSAGGDPNTLATTLLTAVPLFVVLGFYFRNWPVKMAFFFMGLGMVALVTITGSRGSIVALAGITFGGILLTQRKVLVLLIVISLGIGGWFLLPAQYQARYAGLLEISDDLDEASSGRWTIWQHGVEMFLRRPLFGVGAGAFVWANRSGDFGPPNSLQPHNLFIQIAATTGIIGLAVWLAFLASLLSRLRQLLISTSNIYEQYWIQLFAKGFLVTLVALLAAGMFGHTLYRYTWYVVAALVVALSDQIVDKGSGRKIMSEPALSSTCAATDNLRNSKK